MQRMKMWLTAKDLQAMLGVSRSTAYRIIDNLPHAKVGRGLRVSYVTVMKTLRDNGGELPTSDRQAKEGQDDF